MVVVPLAPTERVVATYIGIYSILALLHIVASALLTRLLVTLTFRGLGQVEATAMSTPVGEFGQRISDVFPGPADGLLKHAIDQMLDRLDARISERQASVAQMRHLPGE